MPIAGFIDAGFIAIEQVVTPAARPAELPCKLNMRFDRPDRPKVREPVTATQHLPDFGSRK